MIACDKPSIDSGAGIVPGERRLFVELSFWMHDMILAGAQRALRPTIEHLEPERVMHFNIRMEAIGRLPGSESDCRYVLSGRTDANERHLDCIDDEFVSFCVEVGDPNL